MDEAILKTLILFDILDFPLKSYEIQKFLIEEKGNLNEVDKSLKTLEKKKKITKKSGLVTISKRNILISRRFKRLKLSTDKLFRAKALSKLFFLIPWVKLVGVSGDLSRFNLKSSKEKVSFILICDKNRKNLSLYLVNFILNLFSIANKYNIDWIITKDQLEQTEQNIYSALKILSLTPFWQKKGVYNLLLEKNLWVFEYFPNWINPVKTTQAVMDKKQKNIKIPGLFFMDYLEKKIGSFQDMASSDLVYEQNLAKEYSKRIKRYRLKLSFNQEKVD